MSTLSGVWGVAKSILEGVTQTEVTNALQVTVKDLGGKVDFETTAFDALKALCPQFALYLDIAQIVLVLAPNTKPADWDSAVFQAKDPNPYSPGYTMGDGD